MAGNNFLAQIAMDSIDNKRDQPWKAAVSEPKLSPDQGLVEMVKVGGAINVMTNLLYAIFSSFEQYRGPDIYTAPLRQLRLGIQGVRAVVLDTIWSCQVYMTWMGYHCSPP